MKRLILLWLVVFLCLPFAVYAASIGGAETQGKGKFAIGLDQEYVFDRDMKKKTVADPDVVMKLKIDDMYRTMIKASYGLLDNLDIYVKLGNSNYREKGDLRIDWLRFSDKVRFKGANAFAYGVGLKGAYEFKNNDWLNGWLVGGDAQYLRHKNDFNGIEELGSTAIKGDAAFDEWQVAAYVGKKIANFTPYLGVKYSDLKESVNVKESVLGSAKYRLRAANNVGVFVGTDYKLGDHWKLNLEGRFVDETAMSVGATYGF